MKKPFCNYCQPGMHCPYHGCYKGRSMGVLMNQALATIGTFMAIVFGYVSLTKMIYLPNMVNKNVHWADFHILMVGLGVAMIVWGTF